MKKLLTIPILFLFANLQATNYYVSNTGNNSNAGTSTGAPWQTVAKVVSSFSSINSGDSVLFKRGDVFTVSASILLTKSGIKFGAYGTGARPVLTCLTTVTGWTLVSTGLYKASVSCPNDLRFVTIDGQPVEWGRTPNKNNGLNSYYYSSSYNNGTTKTITLSGLPASPDRTGNRFCLKGEVWATLGIAYCISQSGSTLTYRVGANNPLGQNPSFRYPSRSGTGICFVGNVADCDQYGEWAYDSTANELYMYFGGVDPNTKVVKASTADKIFDFAGFVNASVDNLELEGANQASIFGKNGGANGSMAFRNLKINGSGSKGILFSNQQNVTMTDDTAVNVYSVSFRINSATVRDGATIQRNSISDNGPFETMGYAGDFSEDGTAIVCGANNAVISHNYINRSYYHGIWFTGSNVVVDTNYINRFSMFSTDCGGLYSFALNGYGSVTTYTNRFARNNVIDSGISWVYGYSSLISPAARGIYNDARAHNILYQNNLVNNCDMVSANNSPVGITHRGNTYIGNRGINFRRLKIGNSTDFEIKDNIISLNNPNGIMFAYYTDSLGSQTIAQDFAGDVSIDSNICNNAGSSYNVQTNVSPSTNYTLPAWQTLTGVSASDTLVKYFQVGETGRKVIINWANQSNIFPLNYKYSDYRGNSYNNGTITLPAYGFILLYYTAALDGNPQPPVITNPGEPVMVPWIVQP